ncbi:unnamed protein product [Penicillium olsonii]|uniref:WD40 repeat-like protein n=1 Tax=Penicillium olsonii TaxID=99116 RepID=A0A9W4HT74_PENOL|nr:unnamed protein product [Penicillium olsonii]
MLWNAHDDMEQPKTGGELSKITRLRLSPNGEVLLSGACDGTIGLWDTKDWNLRKTIKDATTIKGETDECSFITSVAMSPDGLKVASSHDEGVIRIWDMSTGTPQHRIDSDPELCADVFFVFSPDGRILAASSRYHLMGNGKPPRGTQIIRLWDTVSSKHVQTFMGSYQPSLLARTVIFSHDGQMLALLFEKDFNIIIELRETATGMLKQTFLYPVAQYEWIDSFAFSPDGKGLELSFTAELTILYQPLGGDFESPNSGLTKTYNSPIRLSRSDRWITLGGERILWLPTEYGFIGRRFVVKGSTIAFFLMNGHTPIIGFNVDGAKSHENGSS